MLAAILILTGMAIMLVGTVLFVVKAFKVSVGWGLGVLLVAPVTIVFLVKNWRESRKSFLISLVGGALIVAGLILGQPVATP